MVAWWLILSWETRDSVHWIRDSKYWTFHVRWKLLGLTAWVRNRVKSWCQLNSQSKFEKNPISNGLVQTYPGTCMQACNRCGLQNTWPGRLAFPGTRSLCCCLGGTMWTMTNDCLLRWIMFMDAVVNVSYSLFLLNFTYWTFTEA